MNGDNSFSRCANSDKKLKLHLLNVCSAKFSDIRPAENSILDSGLMSGCCSGDTTVTAVGDTSFVLRFLPGDCFRLWLAAGDRFDGEGVLFFAIVISYRF